MADQEIAPEQPEETGKKAPKAKKEPEGGYLPVLVELTFTVSAIIVVVVFLSIVGISIYNGASLLDMVIRTSVSLLILGVLLIQLARQIAIGVMGPGSAVEEAMEQNQIEHNEVSNTQSPSEAQ